MVEAQQMQHRGVEVPDGRYIHRGSPPKLVRRAVTGAALDAGAHQPTREPVRIVVPAGRPGLMRRHPPEFRGPQHQGVGQQPSLLQVRQQRRGRLVEDRAVPFIVGLERLVCVPVQQAIYAGSARGAVQVDVTHAALQQPPSQQAVPRIGSFQRIGIVRRVQAVNRLRLARQIHHLRCTQLHLGSQLVRRHPSLQLGVARVRFRMAGIQLAQEFPSRLLFFFGH